MAAHCQERAGTSAGSFLRPHRTSLLAEREGFEPSVHFWAYTHLAGEHLQPLGHLSIRIIYIVLGFLAEGVGFEPTVPFDTAVFKTAALNHSAIPPGNIFCTIEIRSGQRVPSVRLIASGCLEPVHRDHMLPTIYQKMGLKVQPRPAKIVQW
jgi:hypothetical protein